MDYVEGNVQDNVSVGKLNISTGLINDLLHKLTVLNTHLGEVKHLNLVMSFIVPHKKRKSGKI